MRVYVRACHLSERTHWESPGKENACAMVAAAAAAAAMVSMQAKEKAGESAKPNDEKLDKIAERILHNLQLCVTNVHIR